MSGGRDLRNLESCVGLCLVVCGWLCVDQLGGDGECVHWVNHALGFVVAPFKLSRTRSPTGLPCKVCAFAVRYNTLL